MWIILKVLIVCGVSADIVHGNVFSTVFENVIKMQNDIKVESNVSIPIRKNLK